MNCENVFVILTRGPFPSGLSSDAAVEAHLQLCPDCQRLAAALRPNDRLLQESIESDESHALPGYWGNSLGTSGDLAISLTDTVGYRRAQRQRSMQQQRSLDGKNLNVWQFTAAVALGIVLAAALRTLVTVHTPAPLAGEPGIPTAMGSVNPLSLHSAEARLAPLNLKPICRPGKMLTPIEPLSFEQQTPIISDDESPSARAGSCCTQCHRVDGGIHLASTAMARFQQSCRACHD
jgi:hypothetical protein